VTETVEDFMDKMQEKDEKAQNLKSEYKSIVKNGKGASSSSDPREEPVSGAVVDVERQDKEDKEARGGGEGQGDEIAGEGL
jgi:hypothetical protein